MNSKPQFGFVVEYVRDIEEATRFYADIMGLEVERTFPTFVQFEHFALATDQPLSGSDEPELYWLVGDAETAYHEAAARAEVTLPLTQQPYGKVFGIKDPTGRSRFILELAAERPSQAV